MADSVSAILLSRGKRPSGTPAAPLRARVAAHGERAREGDMSAAQAWAQTDMPREWARRTGSTPEAISWALDSER
jgi:hypothetical protein